MQNQFYAYVRKNNFDLERGIASEREHLTIKEYKEVTNYNKTKELLNSVNLELPDTPEIKDFKKFMINRDEKINNEKLKEKCNELNERLII